MFDKMSASESESDPELDVSRYDIEDDLNMYGSPVYKARETTAAPVNEPIQIQAEQNRTQVSVNYIFFGLVYPRANGAKRRARVLIRTAIYTREKESIAKSEVHQISRARGSRVAVSGWSSLISKMWRTILHYNISYFCKKIWQLSQPTKGGHF